MAMFGFARNRVVKRRADGRYEVILGAQMCEVVGSWLDDLDELIDQGPGDHANHRLHPPAYLDDADRDAEYQLLAGEELRTARHDAVETVRSSLAADTLSEDDLWAWLQALNAVRLVVGTRLDITDDDHGHEIDPQDPAAPLWAIYQMATEIQHDIVSALDP